MLVSSGTTVFGGTRSSPGNTSLLRNLDERLDHGLRKRRRNPTGPGTVPAGVPGNVNTAWARAANVCVGDVLASTAANASASFPFSIGGGALMMRFGMNRASCAAATWRKSFAASLSTGLGGRGGGSTGSGGSPGSGG